MQEISFFDKHGLAVIPVKPASKVPAIASWSKRCADDNDSSEFNDDSNVGVVLGEGSNGIVDIDLDAPAAIKIADYFLPETGWKFGRETAPSSHRLYRIKGEVGRREAIMLDGETFAEYRGDGCMTVFPGSIHGKTGEAIQWSKCEEPAVASGEELIGGLKKMAITAAVMPRYKEGSRNDIVNALAGTLFYHGMAINDIKHIVGVLCDVTADEEINSRLECVDTTAERKSSNQSVTGEQQLRELIGNDAVTSIISYLGGQKNSLPAVNRAASSSSSNVLSDDEMNDMGVAKRFASNMRTRVAHVQEYGRFYTYNGQIWENDSHVEITRIFDEFVNDMLDKLRSDNSVSHKEVTRQSTFLLKYRNLSKCESAIALSKSGLRLPMSKLDANPDLMAVKNGVLNLRTGELSDFNPGHYITRQLDVEHDPTAKCPLFEKFLQTTFDGDADLISYVQGTFGYSITPYVNRQEMYIFWGSAANGKSTLMNVIRGILGGYSVSLMRETLFDTASNNTSPDLARLVSVRLAVVQEAESRQRLNAPRIKELTGGDIISVAPKYKKPFDLKPVCKIFMLCNQPPAMDSYDEGLKRRIKLVPFNNVVPQDQRDPDLEQKLNAEASGILNWLLEGVHAYYNKGIRVPWKVADATKQYIQDNDSVSGFLDDEIIRDPNASIPIAALYEAYQQYCSDASLRAETKGGFSKNLKKLGFAQTRNNSVRLWKNLRFKTNEDVGNNFSALPPREEKGIEKLMEAMD
jgi:putative DNA primase/helicase